MENLKDNFNRPINYLRLSVTDRCNLRCFYCINDTIQFIPHKEILRYEELIKLVETAVSLGVTKVRITGGEPLLRKGICDFIDDLAKMGIEDLSLTTNGILLKDNLERLKRAGIKRLNMSLDTLSREKYYKTTGKDCFDKVWEGILKAFEMGFDPIKLNVVAMRDLNFDELTDLAKLTFEFPFHIRFIEYMPMGESNLKETLLTPEIKSKIETIGNLTPVKNGSLDGPAKRFKLDGAKGEIGFISPVSNHFCNECNRLRLTADGQLRPCLLSDHKIDVKTPLREGRSIDEIKQVFMKAVSFKQKQHHLKEPSDKIISKMHSIGG